jgi:hypothetical protein
MASNISVHPRVRQRHPELEDDDVLIAWDNCLLSTVRANQEPVQYVGLGFDAKGRLLEMVAVRAEDGSWLIFHAMTPPSERTYRELHVERS